MTASIELDEATRARFELLAASRRQGVDVLLKEAVAQFLEREAARTDFQTAALEAWADYQTDGLHATASEVDDWLKRLEAGEDAAPPECHG